VNGLEKPGEGRTAIFHGGNLTLARGPFSSHRGRTLSAQSIY
jgi:hypothetical protein